MPLVWIGEDGGVRDDWGCNCCNSSRSLATCDGSVCCRSPVCSTRVSCGPVWRASLLEALRRRSRWRLRARERSSASCCSCGAQERGVLWFYDNGTQGRIDTRLAAGLALPLCRFGCCQGSRRLLALPLHRRLMLTPLPLEHNRELLLSRCQLGGSGAQTLHLLGEFQRVVS